MSNSRPASTSTRPAVSPLPRPQHQVNTQTKIIDTVHGRILCIADIRGRLSALNDLARDANAKAIIHTGDFGFFENESLERINDRTLRHLTMYSPLIPAAQRTHLLSPENPPSEIRSTVSISLLSEFPLLLSGTIKLQIPVYTVWGACEDVLVLEKFRMGTYAIDNLHVLDEATTRLLDVGGVKLRLLGLGGALVAHKMFDNGDGNATIAGGQGTMWTTALQIGELVDTAQRVFDPSETRLLVTHASPGREGIIAQLALVLKVDLTISAGLHFRYATSYNEFSIQGDFEGFRHKLQVGKEAWDKVWDSVRTQVEAVIDDNQRVLLDKMLSVVERLPPSQSAGGAATGEEPAWKNCWNWNLCDAAYGALVLDIKEGRVSAELKSQGFNYAYRQTATTNGPSQTPTSVASPLPAPHNNIAKGSTPVPSHADRPPPPHLNNANNNNKSTTSTPPPAPGTGTGTPKDAQANSAAGIAKSTTNGAPVDNPAKAERDRQKKKDKKERKDRERAERAAADKEASGAAGEASGKATPAPSEPADQVKASPVAPADGGLQPLSPNDSRDDAKSPVTDGAGGTSTGTGTPTGKRPSYRNPYTLFMRTSVPANEGEVREFFGEAKDGITRVNYPANFAGRNLKLMYIEFGDEEAMKAGLEKHAEKLKDQVPEVKQATDRESRGESPFRGRGRGGRGGFAARGFAAAGLTKRGGESGGGASGGGGAEGNA